MDAKAIIVIAMVIAGLLAGGAAYLKLTADDDLTERLASGEIEWSELTSEQQARYDNESAAKYQAELDDARKMRYIEPQSDEVTAVGACLLEKNGKPLKCEHMEWYGVQPGSQAWLIHKGVCDKSDGDEGDSSWIADGHCPTDTAIAKCTSRMLYSTVTTAYAYPDSASYYGDLAEAQRQCAKILEGTWVEL